MTLEQLKRFASGSQDVPGSGAVMLTRLQVRRLLIEMSARFTGKEASRSNERNRRGARGLVRR